VRRGEVRRVWFGAVWLGEVRHGEVRHGFVRSPCRGGNVITKARIVYHQYAGHGRSGERVKGVGWCYTPLIERNVVAMLNTETVTWPDVPPLDTGERLCRHVELGANYLVK
jgi:hypothetical protein